MFPCLVRLGACPAEINYRGAGLFPAEVNLVASLLRQIRVSKHTLSMACFRAVDLFPAEVNLVASLLRQIRVSKHTLSMACFRGVDLFPAD